MRRHLLLIAGLFFAFAGPAAHAVDGTRAMSQYLVRRWGAEQGLAGSGVTSIAQTPDGYLWVGTDEALLRFDGLAFRPLDPPEPSQGPIRHVLTLTVDRSGALWIRMRGARLLCYKDGHFQPTPPQLNQESGITAVANAAGEGILLGTLVHGLSHADGSSFQSLHKLGAVVIALAQTSDGRVWLGSREAGLKYLQHGQIVSVTRGLPDKKINCVLPLNDGKLWIGTDAGLVLWNGESIVNQSLPSPLDSAQIIALLKDEDGNLWVSTSAGLYRYNAGGASLLRRGGEDAGPVNALFEDREGNIWLGDEAGIESVRDSLFSTYSSREGLPGDAYGPIYVDPHGRAWFAPLTGGLYWLLDGAVHRVTQAGLDKDIIYSIAGSGDDIWVGRQRGGLTHLRADTPVIQAETFTSGQRLAQNTIYSVLEAHDGSVWAGTLIAGVSHLNHGSISTFNTGNGLAANSISAMAEGGDGTVWFGTPAGLSSFAAGHWKTYSQSNGLPSSEITSLFEDRHGGLWIGTAVGLAYLHAGRLENFAVGSGPLQHRILGMAEDGAGSLWISTSDRVLRVRSGDLIHGSLPRGAIGEYGRPDGLRGTAGVQRSRSVVEDAGGRVWMTLNDGLSVTNPSYRLADNSLPAIPHIESVTVDETVHDAPATLNVSSAHRRITFNYVGLDLAEPEQVSFRYRLDGFDHGWSEPTYLHQAIYTNLSPGSYRFRVISANGRHVWSAAAASLPLEIQPVFRQTWLFKSLCILAALAIVVMLYRARMETVIEQANVLASERLAERTRIAQDLHDTLLQGFISALMHLGVASDLIAPNSPAKPLLDRSLELMDRVIEQGRKSVQGLRSIDVGNMSLEQAFARVPEEILVGDPSQLRLTVEGRSRRLHPVIHEEVWRICQEALINAYRHAAAGSIEVTLIYGFLQFRIEVKDDGRGLEPQMLTSGRHGHWGLTGMRERAERIGGRLTIRSRQSAGTLISLTIPAHIAYADLVRRSAWQWLVSLVPSRLRHR